ncbi:hypothetical protein BGW39_005785 [Mortierella sp. 14UC]|nr:hypothetical protein BGW39_005785 [Mortierella sp. 14UC]
MTITHIPSDVLHLIAPHLNTYDLVACLQVDRVWNSVFVIHLWRTIDDSQQPWRRLLAEFTDPIPTYYHPQARLVERVPERLLDLVMKYGHHIRRLVVRRPQTVELCLRARDIARMAQRQERTERSLAESLSSSAIIAAPSPTQTAVAGEVATGVGTGVGMVDVDREIREILPCESITVLRFGFLDPVLTFLKRLDRRDSPETPYLTALSAILRKNQRELEPSLTSIHPCLFYQEHDAVDSKLHMVTLARSCWQLVLNNPQLQELDMGPFGAHEDTFFVSGGYLKSTLTSCQRLRALRVGVERTPDFLVRLPTMLPNLKLLWYYDNSPLSLDALVEAAKETRESGAAVAAGQKTTEGVTSDSDERERMPNLRLLDIVAPSQPRHLAAIFSCFPDLAMLSLGVLSMDDAGVSRSGTAAAKTYSDATVLPLQDLGTNLIELHVACWDCPPTILSNSNIHLNSVTRLHLHVISGYKNLLNLLRTFPTLRELQLKKVRTLTDEIEPSYETELPLSTLKSIRLAKEAFATERSLNGLLSLLPNLTEANLYTTHPNTFSVASVRDSRSPTRTSSTTLGSAGASKGSTVK